MIARCHLRALGQAARLPRDAEKFRELLESFPAVCPHNDCSAPSCRVAVADLLRQAWIQKGKRNG